MMPSTEQYVPPETTMKTGDMEKSFRMLQAIFQVVLLAMIVLSGSMFVFLLREVSQVRHQTRELTEFIADYDRRGLPVMLHLRDQFAEFSKAHPDFTPIFLKYFPPTGQPSSLQSTPPVQPLE